jgi:hypothetical protein
MTSISGSFSGAGSMELISSLRSSDQNSGSGLSQSVPGSSMARFEDALRTAEEPATSAVKALAEVGDSPPVPPEPWHMEADRRAPTVETYGEIDRRGGGIEPKDAVGATTLARAVADNRGGMILDGLTRLRSTFNDQSGRINSLSSTGSYGTEQLIGLQIEIVKYSLLMDVTSKLIGKSTQAFDTLMKGQ